MKIYDLIIIGAGPAGVMAATILAETGKTILLIEKGFGLNKRRDLINGWFGQALFSTNFINFEENLNIESIIKVKNLINKIYPEELKNNKIYKMPSEFGNKLAFYIFDLLSNKIDIKFNSEVINIEKNDDQFIIETNKRKYTSKKCLISTGRNSFFLENLYNINLQSIKNRATLGVRVEVPTFKINKIIENKEIQDLKIDSFIGEWEEEGIISSFGFISKKGSNKSSFLINFGPEKTLPEIIKEVKIINVLANDRVKKEKVSDFIKGKSILKYIKDSNELKEQFIKLEKIIPFFINCSIIYIPEIKLKGMIVVDDNMKTKIPKLYAAGRCIYKINNVIESMASGIIAAETIKNE